MLLILLQVEKQGIMQLRALCRVTATQWYSPYPMHTTKFQSSYAQLSCCIPCHRNNGAGKTTSGCRKMMLPGEDRTGVCLERWLDVQEAETGKDGFLVR